MLESTLHELLGRGAGSLSGVSTYLLSQYCRDVLKRCRNLPAGQCVAGVAGCLNSVGTYLRAQCSRGAGCLNGVATFLLALCWALCCRGVGCLSGVRTYLP